MLPPRPRSAKVTPSTSVGLDGVGLEALEHDVVVRREAVTLLLGRVEARLAATGILEAGAVEVAAGRAVVAVE